MSEERKLPMEDPLVERALKGHQEALLFLRAMGRLLHWFDDLIDKDRQVTDAETYEALWTALIELPQNTFYAEHQSVLQPIVANSIVNWRVATNIERNRAAETGDLVIAYVTRSSYIDLATMCALLIGGAEWAVVCGYGLRKWAHSESFDQYLKALADETRAREESNLRSEFAKVT